MKTIKGITDNPDLIIEAPFDMWRDIQMEKVDAQEMLEQRKYHVYGDLSLMKQMQKLFIPYPSQNLRDVNAIWLNQSTSSTFTVKFC